MCYNNCKGVNPNAIIGAGGAAVGVVPIAGQTIANVAGGLGVGAIGGKFVF